MNLRFNIKGTVVSVKKTENQKDPAKPYFSLGVSIADEVGQFNCSEDVAKDVQKFKDYNLGFIHYEKSGFMRIDTANLISGK